MSPPTPALILEPSVEPGPPDRLHLARWRRSRQRAARLAALACFTVVVAAANAATFGLGLVPVGFGLTAAAGTLAAGASGPDTPAAAGAPRRVVGAGEQRWGYSWWGVSKRGGGLFKNGVGSRARRA